MLLLFLTDSSKNYVDCGGGYEQVVPHFANTHWQSFANGEARHCQWGGKALPIGRQDTANAMARCI